MAAINRRDQRVLRDEFAIGPAVLEEIEEELARSFDPGVRIGIAPFDSAFAALPKRGGRSSIDIFEMNEPGLWGIECVIWVDGVAQEPVLHAQAVLAADGALRLRYRHID
ncbi:hypothetical protein ACLBXM_12570 [Xanthobacteraceae bacterium A53D]